MNTRTLALSFSALAGLPGCAGPLAGSTDTLKPQAAQLVIQSLAIPELANHLPARQPWRLAVCWLPGGTGGAAIRSPGYEHVVGKNPSTTLSGATFPVQNEPAPNAEILDAPTTDSPLAYAAEGESGQAEKIHPDCQHPCRHGKPKPRAGKARRHLRMVSYRPTRPCHASRRGK